MPKKIDFNGFNGSQKILHHIDKVDNFLNAGKTLVVTEFDLTNKCNNNCPQCVGVKENGSELTWEEIQMIVRGLKNLGNRGVIVSGGGEPLLHPCFKETIELIKTSGMEVGLNSNGLALTREKALAIAKYCTYFRISLDAGTPSMYMKTHGMKEEVFRKVIENIKLMGDVIKETGSKVAFSVGFLTGENTICDMEDFVKVCKENGAGACQFRPFTGDKTDITEKYKELKEKYEDDSFKVLASLQKYKKFDEGFEKKYDKCRGMFFSTVVTADCKMFACLHHRQDPEYLIGDMRGEGKTLEQVWNSYRKWMIYEKIDVNCCPPFCRNDSFNDVLFELDQDLAHKEFM